MLDNNKFQVVSDDELDNIVGGVALKDDKNDAFGTLVKTKALIETGDVQYLDLCLGYVKTIIANSTAAKMLLLVLSFTKDTNKLSQEVYAAIEKNLL